MEVNITPLPESAQDDRLTKEDELIKSIRESLLDNKKRSEDSHDKAFSTLTAGTLAVSITFISNVVHLPEAIYIFLLITAWALLTIALMINLLGHMVVAGHSLGLLHDLDGDPTQREQLRNRALRFNKKIIRWNRVSVIFSLLAIVLIVTFCAINVYHMQKVTPKSANNQPGQSDPEKKSFPNYIPSAPRTAPQQQPAPAAPAPPPPAQAPKK